MELVKGKVRKVLNRLLKMTSYDIDYHGMCIVPISIDNVRMYIDNRPFARHKYTFEIDVQATVPTYEGCPSSFRFSDNRRIKSVLQYRIGSQLDEVRSKCLMFSGNYRETNVIFKKVSIIRNPNPPSLQNS